MKRHMASALLLATMISPPLCAQEWARKMFETTTHDFGSVARGAKAEYEFVLSNIYLEDVHIASVRSSCGFSGARKGPAGNTQALPRPRPPSTTTKWNSPGPSTSPGRRGPGTMVV